MRDGGGGEEGGGRGGVGLKENVLTKKCSLDPLKCLYFLACSIPFLTKLVDHQPFFQSDS